ncbi:MAG: hypothetical protein IJ327_04155 [Lachnospiraceae bacterium]|nr:hypothetical protein [Lachnospiraceae bacterium]
MQRRMSGYLSVFMALVLTLLTGFCLGLIEGVRKNGMALESECAVEAAWNGVFAEYHRGLVGRYNLFALDDSYGTSYGSVSNIERHLTGYLDRNLQFYGGFWNNLFYKDFQGIRLRKAEIQSGLLLSDHDGAVFRCAAVGAQKDKLNLTLLEKTLFQLEQLQVNGLDKRNIEAEKAQADYRLQQELDILEQGGEVVDFQNPTIFMEEIRKKGILSWVTGDKVALSPKALRREELFAARLERGDVQRGNRRLREQSGLEQMVERFLFQEYLLTYMGNFIEPMENSALDYEIEYLLVGEDRDVENLHGAFSKICGIREAANVMYLLTDEDSSKKTELIATVLMTLIGQPQLAVPVQFVLTLGWAFGETLYDMECLAAGGAVPLLKTEETWHYSLENLLKGLVGRDEEKQEQLSREGMYYRDYLRVLLFLVDLDVLTLRSMDLVEADIRLLPGNSNFCLDHCYVELEADISLESDYGYSYEIRRLGTYQE